MDTRLSWPPPGLEKLHGTLWPVVRRVGAGAMLFTFPLLVAIATEQPFSSLGPFGTSYWIPALTSTIALFILFAAAFRLSALLRHAANGARLGYGRGLLLTVAADASHDSGFVLQGARHYQEMSSEARRNLLGTRKVGPLLYLLASVWLPFGLCLGIALGMGGLIEPALLWFLTLAPAGLLGLAGLAARGLEGTLLRQAAKSTSTVAIADAVEHQAEQWRSVFDDVAAEVAPAGPPPRPRQLRFAAAFVFAPALLLVLPVLAIASVTVLGPLVATIVVPSYGRIEGRLRSVELVREYGVPRDPTISATAGGRALANLTYLSRRELNPLLQPPSRWLAPTEFSSVGLDRFIDVSVAPRLRERSFTPEEQIRIRAAARSDAHAEVSTVARASGLDIVGTRWVTPFPDTLSISTLPIGSFGGVREAALLHVLRGYQLYLDGDTAAAERMMRETISLGLQMVDYSPTLIDGLIGRVIAFRGANALRNLYVALGRDAEARLLTEKIHASNLLTENSFGAAPDVRTRLANLPRIIADSSASRVQQWESLAAFSTFAPCLNLHRAVFANDPKYDEWLSSARKRLVRYPADNAMFELVQKGMIPPSSRRGPRCSMSMEIARQVL